jgi:two-component sensor histidine kinase
MRWLARCGPVYNQPFWHGQAIAFVTVLVAVAIRASVSPFINGGLNFTFLFPGILVAGLFGGIWSGISAAFLGGLLMAYVWIPPSFTIALTADGIFRLTLFWTLAAMMIFLTAFVHVVLDRLAASEAGAKTVASEMKHRVQNNLALVQAIVRQTFQNSDTLSEAQILLTDRLAALGRAHDLMQNFEEKNIKLQNLVRKALEPFDVQRFVVAGSSSIIIPQDCALSLMLLIHELATNAAKYGAMSIPAGRVDISWIEEPMIHKVSFEWKERLGPPVDQPSRAGFGSKLLQAAFAREGANANIIYEPDGVHCTVVFSTCGQTSTDGSAEDVSDQPLVVPAT